VLSLTEGVGELPSSKITQMNIQSTEDGTVLASTYSASNLEPEEYEYQVTLTVYDSDGQNMMWNIIPPVDTFIMPPMTPDEVRPFTVEVPPGSVIGEYEMRFDLEANPTIPGPPSIMEQAHTSFNVIKYGFVELEVETS
jgi:hypothetical protein